MLVLMDLSELDARALLTDGVDIVSLRNLYLQNSAAAALLDLFAQRWKASKVTKIMRATNVLNATDARQQHPDSFSFPDVVSAFRALQLIGCGSLLETSGLLDSYFIWKANLITVGRFASTNTPVAIWKRLLGNVPASVRALALLLIAGLQEDPVNPTRPTPEPFVLALPPLSHTFVLRPRSFVTLSLPQDFTPNEAKRLAAFVRTLPFTSSASPAAALTSTHLKLPQPITQKIARPAH